MATNLGTLTLNLLANTGSYIQGLSRAERQTRNSTREWPMALIWWANH